MPAVIELENLEVRLGERTILDRLNGSLSGRCIGLLGPNGSGKSTLINALLGFYRPVNGRARIFGKEVQSNLRELRAQIGYMPESDAFIADMSGVRFVRYMAEISGLPPGEAMERAHEAFFHVGLGEARYRKLGTYSLGMKQLAKLAQAIAHGPRLLLLDEPTNGLDPEARLRMLQLVREIRDTGEVNVLISSLLLHDVEE
jgi:ABC-2 type transport system ATP-binding protein